MIRKFAKAAAVVATLAALAAPSAHATIGYADVVLFYFDSGAGPFAGPYGGTISSFPVPVSTSVVLGSDIAGSEDFLSLPTGSYVTVGFTDEVVIDGVGNDIFIQEIGLADEKADVFVSSDGGASFTFLGVASSATTTAFDLASIGYTSAVNAIKIVGKDALGGSPGFDLANVQVLPGSIGVVPEPGSLALALLSLGALGALGRRGKRA